MWGAFSPLPINLRHSNPLYSSQEFIAKPLPSNRHPHQIFTAKYITGVRYHPYILPRPPTLITRRYEFLNISAARAGHHVHAVLGRSCVAEELDTRLATKKSAVSLPNLLNVLVQGPWSPPQRRVCRTRGKYAQFYITLLLQSWVIVLPLTFVRVMGQRNHGWGDSSGYSPQKTNTTALCVMVKIYDKPANVRQI